MKNLRVFVGGIVVIAVLAMVAPAQATDAQKITDELFAELDEAADVELLNDAAFEGMRLAQAEMDADMEEFERSRAEREVEMAHAREEMAHAREEMEEAAREMARLGQEMAGQVVIRLRDRQNKAMLGITLASGDETGADGVGVAGVSADGPAAKAGLQAGDVLVEIDGNSLKGDDDESAIVKLVEYMEDVEPGRQVTVDYLRDGKPYTVVIETTEFAFPNFAFDFNFGEILPQSSKSTNCE